MLFSFLSFNNFMLLLNFLFTKITALFNINNQKYLTAKQAKCFTNKVIKNKIKLAEREAEEESKINQELLEEVLCLIKQESEKGSYDLLLECLKPTEEVDYRTSASNLIKYSLKYSSRNYNNLIKKLIDLGYRADQINNFYIRISWEYPW